MKHLKKITYLLFALAFIVSCEKETDQEFILENNGNLLDQIKNSDGIDSNVNEIYYEKLFENYTPSKLSRKDENSIVTFYSNKELFESESCYSEVSKVDFEDPDLQENEIVSMNGPINEDTNNGYFSPGDIPYGIEFKTDYYNDIAIRNFGHLTGQSHRLSVNYADDNLLINFNGNKDIHKVSFELSLSYVDGYIDVEVYGTKGIIGIKNILSYFETGTFVGISSPEAISYIRFVAPIQVNQAFVWERIDNVTFVNCDFDDDGCFDNDDPHPNSNLSETIVIDGCDSGVENGFTACGTTMMDEINDLIAKVSAEAQKPRSRYRRAYNAQGAFKMGMYFILAKWQSRRYVTRSDNSAIMRCVGRSNIDFEGNEPD